MVFVIHNFNASLIILKKKVNSSKWGCVETTVRTNRYILIPKFIFKLEFAGLLNRFYLLYVLYGTLKFKFAHKNTDYEVSTTLSLQTHHCTSIFKM